MKQLHIEVLWLEKKIDNLQKLHKKTGISVTRLLNCAVKEFLEKYDNKR